MVTTWLRFIPLPVIYACRCFYSPLRRVLFRSSLGWYSIAGHLRGLCGEVSRFAIVSCWPQRWEKRFLRFLPRGLQRGVLGFCAWNWALVGSYNLRLVAGNLVDMNAVKFFRRGAPLSGRPVGTERCCSAWSWAAGRCDI